MPYDDGPKPMSDKQRAYALGLWNGAIDMGLPFETFPPALVQAGDWQAWVDTGPTSKDCSDVIDQFVFSTGAVPRGKELKSVSAGQLRYFYGAVDELADLGDPSWTTYDPSGVEYSWTMSMLTRRVDEKVEELKRAIQRKERAAAGQTQTNRPPIEALADMALGKPASSSPAPVAVEEDDLDALPFE